MANLDSTPPDALVLGGGGVLGEAWLSAVLAGIAQGGGFDARGSRFMLGTSAGSIVAASLAAGIDPASRLELAGEGLASAAGVEDDAPPSGRNGALAAALELGGAAAAPLASLALNSTAGGGAMLRRAMLRRVPRGERSMAELGRIIDAAAPVFDGRLLIAAVELESGRRVIFGSPGAPSATVAQAVLASCAIPGVFSPVSIGAREYVDGGAWSPTNMDAVPAGRGERVLCLNPTGSLRPSRGALVGAIGPISRGAASSEALALRHRGAHVRTINPDEASAGAMGVNLMSRSRRAAVIAAGHAQGLRLAGAGAARAA
ncbi:MAG TPA: patatin-like phospholipase family protein [Solirubrobacteraceae bacterium]